MDFKILITEEVADIREMVCAKSYLRRSKYTWWYYCFIGEFARLDGRILVKGMLTETRRGWGRDKVEMSFHYSASHVSLSDVYVLEIAMLRYTRCSSDGTKEGGASQRR
jgi:hypothetical protein